MAKNIIFSTGKAKFQAAIVKVDRNKVYGYTEEVLSDGQGGICTYGNLLEDGKTIFLSGGTTMKVVNENNEELEKSSLKTVYMDGTPAVLVPSSAEIGINLQPAILEELYDLEVSSVYQLEFENQDEKKLAEDLLRNDNLFGFIFNYRADYEGADAILMSSDNGIFILTGRKLNFMYQANETIQFAEVEPEQAIEEEEMDFGML